MEWLKTHPLATLALGAVLGIMFSQQIKRVPGVSRIPQV